MANTCFTDIFIYGDKEKLSLLNEKFKTIKAEKQRPYGALWFGELLKEIGYPEKDVLAGTVARCRGDLVSIELEENRLCLLTESAWIPMLQCIRLFVEHYVGKDCDIRYISEEPGCAIFVSNDPDIVGKCYFSCWDDLPEELEFLESASRELSEKELETELSDLLGQKGSLDELTQALEAKYDPDNERFGLFFGVYRYVPIEQCA